MRQPSIVTGSIDSDIASSRHSWISTGIAVVAIAAAAVLCLESFVEADRSMERMHATATQSPKAHSGTR